MSRLGRRRSSIAAAVVLAALTAPAAAHAATYSVSAGDGPCGGTDLASGGLAEAAAAAAAGDVFNVAPGSYSSATFSVGGVTIAGAPNFTVSGTLTFTASSGGVSRLQKAAISQGTGTNPGVVVTGSAGLEISDTAVLSVGGDGVTFADGVANKIQRSVIITGGASTAAVRVTSADTSSAAKGLTMDSTLVTGGAAGLAVNTGNGGPLSTAGDVAVSLRHVTAAGSTNGLVLDASQAIVAVGGPAGDITAEVIDSIIQNGTAKAAYPGVPLLAPANTVTDTYPRTLQGAFDPAAVFVNPTNRNFRLRPGSPAINAGGFTPGESTTDIDGQDRSAPPTDQGADEFVAGPAATTPPAPGATNDGTPPAIVVTKPTPNQRIKLTTRRTRTVRRDGRRVRRTTTTRLRRLAIAGTARDASGVKGVIVTIQKLGTAAGAKCKWFNATKGIVLRSCTRPPLLLARLAANGTWTYNANARRLSAGRYRIIVFGGDNSGANGNSAPPGDAVRRFTLTRR